MITLYRCPNTSKVETLEYWYKDFKDRQQLEDDLWWDFEAHMSTFAKVATIETFKVEDGVITLDTHN